MSRSLCPATTGHEASAERETRVWTLVLSPGTKRHHDDCAVVLWTILNSLKKTKQSTAMWSTTRLEKVIGWMINSSKNLSSVGNSRLEETWTRFWEAFLCLTDHFSTWVNQNLMKPSNKQLCRRTGNTLTHGLIFNKSIKCFTCSDILCAASLGSWHWLMTLQISWLFIIKLMPSVVSARNESWTLCNWKGINK